MPMMAQPFLLSGRTSFCRLRPCSKVSLAATKSNRLWCSAVRSSSKNYNRQSNQREFPGPKKLISSSDYAADQPNIRRWLSSSSNNSPNSTGVTGTTPASNATITDAAASASPGGGGGMKVTPSMAGTGRGGARGGENYAENKTPVTWTMLFLVGVAAASAVAYYRIERERRLERAMGKIVSSELFGEEGWSPSPNYAKRVFVPTKYGWFPKDDGWTAAGKPAIGGPWSLVDLDGNLVTNESFVGKWLLLYFGFARCPDICPSEMNKVGQVMDTLKTKHPELYKKVVPVFVSVDPARDSLRALREYARDFHPDYVMLTGSPQQVQRMAKQYRVYVSKADETDDDYLVDHSIVIYFHDDTGDLADCFTQSMRASDVVERVIEKMTTKPTGLLK